MSGTAQPVPDREFLAELRGAVDRHLRAVEDPETARRPWLRRIPEFFY